MKTAENSIKRSLDAVEKSIQKENPSNYIIFDMTVLARWNTLTDSETINGLKSANSAMTEEQITKLREMIANNKDPKFCQSVVYVVNDIKLNGKESIGSEGITVEIEPDTFLDKILIKKTNK